jgi:hypothetical protein
MEKGREINNYGIWDGFSFEMFSRVIIFMITKTQRKKKERKI